MSTTRIVANAGHVTLVTSVGGTQARAILEPETARSWAASLLVAAEHAERQDRFQSPELPAEVDHA